MTTEFIVKNDEENINKFKTYIENNRIHYPSVLEGDDNDELDEVIDQLQSANNPESEFYGGYFGITYDLNRLDDAIGHFILDHMGGTEIYQDARLNDLTVKKFPEIINTENYPTPPQSPRKKGGKRRKKKKTRKKIKSRTRKQRGGERTRSNWIKYDEISPFDVCVFCEESLLNPTSPEKTAYMLSCEHVGHTDCIVDWCRRRSRRRYDLLCPACDNEIWEDCTDTDEYLLQVQAERRGEERDEYSPDYDIFNNPHDYWRLPQLVVEPASIRARPRRRSTRSSSVKPARSQGGRRKRKTRKKRGAVKFGKNKTTAEIVKEGRKILQTTPQKKKRQMREQQIKLTGKKELALFNKQAMNRMNIAFIKSFNQPPSDKDKKMLSLVYKSLKQPLNKKENEIIQYYRAENNNNKRKFVWMNTSLRQVREMSKKRKRQIYNTGDNPEAIKKYRPRERKRKEGPATGLVIDTDKYMSPVKGPDTRYPKLSLDIRERTNKNLFKGGRNKKTRKNKNKKRRTKKKSRRRR